MFLLALTAFLLSALGLAVRFAATGSKAAIGAADREGMPAQSHTNHPAHTREARVTSDASSPSATAGVCPDLAEGDDLETCNTTLPTHGLPSSASPAPSRGPGLGVSHDRAGQPLPLCEGRATGLDLSSCEASPRPRIKPGDAATLGVRVITTPALPRRELGPPHTRG